ncbi:hypothetical protein [Carboxylicivirga caseinilyticus]|uniref:hypothetical protein n=1 Tax=Carboxylicivirga caseinilyticus TaxID=3417572 RepID=UPI003D347480|nr:hypothetical protein [Marinilabiliaceae bacterium A049]
MIYSETLFKYDKNVKNAFEKLQKMAEQNQRNKNDILLICINGWRNIQLEDSLRAKKLSPFMIGSGVFGHCYFSIYDFYDAYRRNVRSKSEITDEERDSEEFKRNEKLSIDLELMIYLKFWESDIILSKLLNLVNLALGKSYDWELLNGKIEHRRIIIKDYVQAPLKGICPELYDLIEEVYSNQIRNAIAHSKYYHVGRNIILGNKPDSKHYKLSNITYDEWEVRFHKVLLMFNHFINAQNEINERYIEKVRGKHFGLPITIPEKDKLGLDKIFWIKYFEVRGRWDYK